jgi:CelD/BcsL family acetyltransferase involved in cellulose biosynthesis
MLAAAAGAVEPEDWLVARVVSGERLDALAVVRPARVVPVFGMRVVDTFHSHYGPRNPALLRAGAEGAPDRLLDALAPLGSVVRMHNQALDGPVAALLSRAAERRGGAVLVVDAHQRACLLADRPADEALGPALEGKRRKELDRQLRRLGTIAHHVGTDPVEVAAAFETFVALERMGWKGERGTSLADDDRRLDFARRLVSGLAAEGRVRTDTLDAAGRPVSALVSLMAGDTGFIWKIAHDPDLAAASPGVQVVRMATRGFLDDPGVRIVDSLATADHPMIDRVWQGRLAIGTLFLALDPAAVALARRAAALHAGQGMVRTRVRDLVRRITG